ncbi:exported hypothetical protein [Cupriavidus oxalaticus]|uniref:Uncharacterized protein n=1 Tax=Cupriavidus oxalaticus TaxID=96344 RepID=A0A976BI25_9BURK|nr:exported hypothetical protein [Cupriavidus oxalaticus]
MGTWFALLAPAALPAPVQQKLEKALAEVANAPATRARMVELAGLRQRRRGAGAGREGRRLREQIAAWLQRR